jgi:hypothetical protein
LALDTTADIVDGIPNYRFLFFGLLTIGTTGTERSGGTFGTASASTPLNLPANGRPRWRSAPSPSNSAPD